MLSREKIYDVSEDVNIHYTPNAVGIFPLHLSNLKHIDISQVYLQLERLSCQDPPYKSVAALNCIVLGCANIWDLDRAYQTFEAISSPFELTPDIHSYNALMYAFGKLKKVILQYFFSL